MTAQSLIHYLQDPKHLYDITYQELNNLVAQYPYCQNLRYLLAQKSKLEQHKNYPRDLELAATYSIDRSRLHKQIELKEHQATDNEPNIVFEEEYLELKELSKLEKQLEENSFSPAPTENFTFLEHGFDTNSELDLSILETPNPSKAAPAKLAKELLPIKELEDAFEFEAEKTVPTKPIVPIIEKEIAAQETVVKPVKELITLDQLEDAFEFEAEKTVYTEPIAPIIEKIETEIATQEILEEAVAKPVKDLLPLEELEDIFELEKTDNTEPIVPIVEKIETETATQEILEESLLPVENLIPISELEDILELEESILLEDKSNSTVFEDLSSADLEETVSESKDPAPNELIAIEDLEKIFNLEEEELLAAAPSTPVLSNIDQASSEKPKDKEIAKSTKKLIAIEDLEDTLEVKEDIPLEITNEAFLFEDIVNSTELVESESLIDRILNEVLPETPKEEFLIGDNIMNFNDFIEQTEDERPSNTELGEKISDDSFNHEVDPTIKQQEIKELFEEVENNFFEEQEEVEDIEIRAVSDRAIPPEEQKQIPIVENIETVHEEFEVDLVNRVTLDLLFEGKTVEEEKTNEIELPKTFSKENEVVKEIVEEPILQPTLEQQAELFEKDIVFLEEEILEEEEVIKITPTPPISKEIETTTVENKERPVPSLDKQSFNHWLKKFQPSKNDTPIPQATLPQVKPMEAPQKVEEQAKVILKKGASSKKKKKDKKKKKKKDSVFARKSILESEEIISQTLADLLAAQGYSEKAIKMYERLSLIFPEKSSFFAEKIKELSYFKD